MSSTIPFISNIAENEKNEWLESLGKSLPDSKIVPFEQMGESDYASAQVAIVANPVPEDLKNFPNLKWVQSLWAGVDQILKEIPDAPFRIVRMVDPQLAETMSEAVLAWTLYLHRDMPLYRAQQNRKVWVQHPLPLPSEQNVGILGMGHLGKISGARLAQQGFNVLGWSRREVTIDNITMFHGEAGLDDILGQSNILVILLPLTSQTTELLNKGKLSKLPPRASLINFARGAIVDTGALIEHLDSGHLKHAVLDVFETEPLPETSALWDHQSITVLPHISGPTNIKTASDIVAKNVTTFFDTGEIPASVNRNRGY